MDPINYNIQVKDPFESSLQAAQAGVNLSNLAEQQAEKQRLIQQQQQMRSDLATLAQNPNPTANDFASMTIKYPELADHFKNTWNMLDTDRQKTAINQASQVYSALMTGNNDVAQSLLEKQAEAAKNAGRTDDAQHAETLAKLVEMNPATAKTSAGLMLASALGPDKFAENFSKISAIPSSIQKGEAEATSATLEAQNKPTEIDLSNLTKAQALENGKIERQLKVLDGQIKIADSETKRQDLQLKRDQLVQKQQQLTQGNAEAAQSQMDTINSTLATVDKVLNHPGLESGTGFGSDINAFFSGSEAADFRAVVDTLKSQQFLAQAKELKGMGALSDAEGARIERAVSSLNTNQSPEAFKESLGVIKDSLLKAQRKLTASGKPQTSGGAFVMSHPTFGNVTEGDINKMLAQYPGTTREQVMEYLKSTGGQ